jgi:cysteine desulfurase
MEQEFGNAGSRTHCYGQRARTAVEAARDRVAAVVGASRGDVIFTSGATESNNLAILGVRTSRERPHVITSAIEHNSVLEPVRELQKRGFDVTALDPGSGGWIRADDVAGALRPDTALVTIMHANNETGVLQPIQEIACVLQDHPALFHVDAAQSYGKESAALKSKRIDMISASGHKIHAPKGVGALIVRRRADGKRPELAPLLHGGGQERGLRPGTLPVHLIAGFGKAAELAKAEFVERSRTCLEFKQQLLDGLAPLNPVIHGDPTRTLPNIVNLSISGIDAEEAMEAWREFVAISDGAACTSMSQQCSHVLAAMRLPGDRMHGALRFSWCHTSLMPDLKGMVDAIRRISRV